ncbi:Pex24p-domain-containing protein [Pleomassaria siparia CBS 279.74]|uniref:Pex24p-domain-containing protein n=1 Tax=Pleomassaria siparia CBS 279.74 TaxID=1314801 RepID=A0A6G1KBX0_9PLEO|nr:Pex24p-domain-containing protein [Pleomassaria siparia CBS 279.74]
MSNEQSDSVANRDTPIPLVSVTGPDNQTPNAQDDTKHHISASKLKDKLQSLGDNLERLLSQVLPSRDYDDDDSQPTVKDRRSRTYVDRPSFSLPLMSTNFRRFNARIGVAFVFQNRAIRLFTWRQPTQTLSFLFVYTFVCVNPTLLAVLPLAAILFFIMVPAFLARHPPPPTHLPTDLYPLSGPPLAAAQTIKPAPELSKDFFRNMRDLQNSMEDFSRVHDSILAFTVPLTNFSNEALSSTLYLALLFTSVLLFITAHLLPFRFLLLVVGYTLTVVGHPYVADLLSAESTVQLIENKQHESRSLLLQVSKSDISLQPHTSTREVEIFELQHRPLHLASGEYEAVLFSPSPYAPLSPSRVAGDRPRGRC